MKKMRIGIIGPCETEIAPFLKVLGETAVESRAMLKFHIGKYKNIDTVALFCGVGKVNAAVAAQVLIDIYGVTHIIVTGVAGAIDENLKVFDTVVSSEIAHHDVAKEILTAYHPWMKSAYFSADKIMAADILSANSGDETVFSGRIVTGEAFIDQDGRSEIIANHSPLCVDMETAAVAQVCYVNAIPFAAIRSMSDTPGESGTAAFERYFERAAEKSAAVLIKYLDAVCKKDI